MGAFPGFPAAAVEFFVGLREDNSREYWQAHRETYEAAVRAPMESLLDDLSAEFGPSKMFRPYRDVRFAKDKSPYQTHIAAGLGNGPAGWYLALKYDALIVGFGLYDADGSRRARIRDAIVDERRGAALEAIVEDLVADGFVLSGDSLKTAPRGYPPDHPRIALLRRQSIVLARSWPPGSYLQEPAVGTRLADCCRAGLPLVDWLNDIVE